ncbi:hypothetical protein TASIC1_0012009400 [Trichoderma asperellum]|uniref:Cytochrome b561 domain-containing protein n=1 Tax=Trichoderma asperellum TaxID=101201 RepID=A0A6V8R1Z3_TRIAP|nr:hypothetical protein TASIC1_0012009400 [Trichoderma asperellum]
MRRYGVTLPALLLTFASSLVLAQEINNQVDSRRVQLNDPGPEKYKIWNRERNAHACIMSIVFIVLYPLGAISLHLPLLHIPYLRNTYLQNKVMAMHVPIQLIGFVMMIGGFGLGIKVASFVGFLSHPPLLGLLQHRYFKRTGGKSKFAYMHRWLGRGAIITGMINTGVGFQLAQKNVIIHASSYVRSYVILGILTTIWVSLILYDERRWRKQPPFRMEEKRESQEQPLQ